MASVPSAAVALMVILGGGLGLLLLPRNSTQLVIGSLNAESLSRLFHVMLYMSGLLPCVALINALTNGYYAKGDTRTPTRVGVWAFTIGAGMKVAGYCAGGIMGMAVAVSVYAIIYCAILFTLLERQTKQLLVARLSTQGVSAQSVMQRIDINPSIP